MIRPFGGSSTRWHSLRSLLGVSTGKLYVRSTRYVRIATTFPFLSGGNYSPYSRLAVSHFALFSWLKRWLSAWRWRSSTLSPAWDQRQLSSLLRHIPGGQNGLMSFSVDTYWFVFSILFFSLLFLHVLACPACLLASKRRYGRVGSYGSSHRRLLLSFSVFHQPVFLD